ncbi:MAG: hypothetical protein HZB99_03770 [Candidatus Harrisonbacteria bacterium]|nr:hypothetical protein [Candidatus Harrisonbacteria bacterium]
MSTRKIKKGLAIDELTVIYQQAADGGFWIKELVGQPGAYMATAIPIKKLKQLLKYAKKEKSVIGGKRMKTLHDVYNSLKLGDVVNLGLGLPGSGKTREEACKNALEAAKKEK